jgi:hypothetical protein
MTFLQRLKFYGAGFVIGMIILIYILGQKGCRGTNEMKVVELASQKKIYSEKARCKLKALGLNDSTIDDELMKMKYRVVYEKSDIHLKPCGIYRLESQKPDSARFHLTVCDCDTVSEIKDIEIFAKYITTNCDSLK